MRVVSESDGSVNSRAKSSVPMNQVFVDQDFFPGRLR